ncbi:TPA: hypothetical protein ENS27_11185 [bacterium]|nr:hypothetical protein [bacterium]
MICNILHERNWDGIVEFDCRPIRTTTNPDGMKMFLKHCTLYWRILEEKVKAYQSDPIIAKIKAELNQTPSEELQAVVSATQNGKGVVSAVEALTKSFSSFEATSKIDTDVIEAHIYRLIQIITGTQEMGAVLFKGTRWEA